MTSSQPFLKPQQQNPSCVHLSAFSNNTSVSLVQRLEAPRMRETLSLQDCDLHCIVAAHFLKKKKKKGHRLSTLRCSKSSQHTVQGQQGCRLNRNKQLPVAELLSVFSCFRADTKQYLNNDICIVHISANAQNWHLLDNMSHALSTNVQSQLLKSSKIWLKSMQAILMCM